MWNLILSATRGLDCASRRIYALFNFSYSVNAIATT